VRDAVRGAKVVQRRPGGRGVDARVELGAVPVRQKDGSRLRAKRDHVAGPVVFLVAAGPLVLADDLGVVLVERERGRDPGLLVPVDGEPVGVESRRRLAFEHALAGKRFEGLRRLAIDLGRVRIGPLRQVDFGPGDVEKAPGVARRQRARFRGADHVVGDRGHVACAFRDGAESRERSSDCHGPARIL
jgi:hypothetical protein